MDSEPDEFAAYQASRGRKKGASGGQKMPFKDVIQTQTRQGLDWGLTDEAKGMQSLMGLPEWAGDAANKLLVGAPVFNIGTGIAGLIGESQAPKGEAGTGAYYDARDAERAKVNQAWEDRPVTSFGAQLAGSAAYPGGALKPGAPLIKETLKMAFLGAMQGGAYGYSSAEGDTQDRADAAKMGAAFGGAAGGTMPAGSAVLRVPFRAAKGFVADTIDAGAKLFGVEGKAGAGHAEQVARAAVLRSMERSGMKPEDVLKAIDEFGDKPAVLAEVIGQDAVNALTALTRGPGATAQKAQDIIADRFGGFAERAADDLRSTTGLTDQQIAGNFDAEIAKRQAEAAPAYQALYEQQGSVASPRLDQLAGTNTLKGKIANAEKDASDLAVAQGRDPSSVTRLEVLDTAKRSLDGDIAQAIKSEDPEAIMRLQTMQTALLNELDSLTGGQYAVARDLGGEAPRIVAARAAGEKAMRPSVPRNTVNEQVNALRPQDRSAYASGVASKIDEDIANGRMAPQRFRLPANQEKVTAAFGEDAGGEFIKRMKAEAELRDLGARWGPRMNAVTGTVMSNGPEQLAADGIRIGSKIAQGRWVEAMIDVAAFMRRRGFSQKQIDAMGDLLLSDPREGLKRLGIRLPTPNNGAPTNGLAASTRGKPPNPNSARDPQNVRAQFMHPGDIDSYDAAGNAIFKPGSEGEAMARGVNTSANTQSGFTADMASAAAGSVGGSVYGSQNDLNGDGVIDDKDAQIGALGGMAAGGLGSAGIRGANRIGRAPLGAPTQYRVRPGESGTFNVQSRAGGQRWQRDNYPFATAGEAQAEIASRQGGNAPAWQVDDAIRAVRNSRTPQEFWDNVRTIPEGPQRNAVMMDMMRQASTPEQRASVLDQFMGAASDWKQREQIARQFLRDNPTDWRTLYSVWPSSPSNPMVRAMDGVPTVMEMASEEAPGIAQTIMRTQAGEYQRGMSGALDALDGAPAPEPSSADIVPFRKPEPPKMSGINALAGPAGGAFTGGVMPIPSTGDPEQDRNNRLMAIAGGALAGSRTGRGAIRAAASGGIKTARQAMRAELPGSPEYERAIAKGLDMSQPARMQRARDMGFDTDTVLYHGTGADIQAFNASGRGKTSGTGVWLSADPKKAGSYAPGYDGKMYPVYVKNGNIIEIDAGGRNWADIDTNDLYVRYKDGTGDLATDVFGLDLNSVTSTDELAAAAREAGFDGLRITNVIDHGGHTSVDDAIEYLQKNGVEINRYPDGGWDASNVPDDMYMKARDYAEAQGRRASDTTVIFDPSNIRSVNAAFDPDMAASPILTAGIGGRPPKLPKIMKDVPKGRPPAQGNPRLGTGNFLKEQVDNTRPPRLAEGPMTDTQIAARRKQDAVNPLLNQGLSADAIKQQTGIQTMVYKGKAFILPESTNNMTSEQVQRAFYDSFALPFEQRPGWVKQIIRATADEEGKALAAQGLWDSKNPVVLGTERTPMIRPGPNVPPENLNALARMPEPRR